MGCHGREGGRDVVEPGRMGEADLVAGGLVFRGMFGEGVGVCVWRVRAVRAEKSRDLWGRVTCMAPTCLLGGLSCTLQWVTERCEAP